MQIVEMIPSIEYRFKFNTLNIQINDENIIYFINQDYKYAFQTKDGVTTKVSQAQTCENCKTEEEVYSTLTKHFERPMAYQYEWYNKIAEQITSLREKYIVQQKIVDDAKNNFQTKVPQKE